MTAGGNWLSALPLYDQLVADRRSDELKLRVERLPGLILNTGSDRTFKELDDLDAVRELLNKADQARLRLLRGDYFMTEGKEEDARCWIREALDTRALSPADEQYARGLLSEKTALALVHFQNAIKQERGHPRRIMLCSSPS